MAKALEKRKNVPEELTWDLSDIYPDKEAMFADVDRMCALAKEMKEEYCGKLESAENIADCLTKYQEILRIMMLAGNYSDLAVSVDYLDRENREVNAKVSKIMAQVISDLSFVDSQISEAKAEELEKAAKISPSNARYLKEILDYKPHQLHPDTEKALAALGQTFGSAYEIYNIAKLGDMKFPNFEAEGKTYPLGYSLFEDCYEYEADTEVRRNAYEAFSHKLEEYVNVTAAAYNAQVQKEKTLSELRSFDNVFDSLLWKQHVSRKMYDRQIDLIMEKLAPHMRRYAKLLQRVHHLDRITYADLKLPVDPGYAPEVTIPQAREYIEKGLAVMGEDYVKMIGAAFENRWIDFAQNEGKSTGGFCASIYGSHSYILLNWNNKMSDVFTLAHELGHAGNFKYCNAEQSILDIDVSTYFVEAPSTMNEILLGHYLLKTSDDKRFRRWVLANMIGNTYYHNFVTHFLEAAYQREVYRIVDDDGSVQADTLNEIMKDTLEKFWGDSVDLLPGCEMTWMRQPHYYMGLYSYTYSAGLTVATQAAERIEKEGAPAVEDWIRVLKAGNTLDPIGLAALAKVDITTDAPLLDTIGKIGAMIDEIEKLTEELDAEA